MEIVAAAIRSPVFEVVPVATEGLGTTPLEETTAA